MSSTASAGEARALDIIGVTSPREASAEKVGSKARNLMLMSEAGLSVPWAFVLGTAVCRDFHEAGGHLDAGMIADVERGIRAIEGSTGLRFGAGRRPLLLSVRSGAAVAMPGMLETILNVGLSDATLPGLLRSTGNPVFVWDSYRRLVQAYAEVVDECDSEPFDRVLT